MRNNSNIESMELQIFNINGLLIRNYGKVSGNFNSFTFNNTPGIYIVKAVAGNRIITAKVFIQ